MDKPKQVYGAMDMGWGAKIVLPLEEAHKVQAILARHALAMGSVYRPVLPNVSFIGDLEVPSVSVLDLPSHDCRGLSREVLNAWKEMVKNTEDGPVMDPQVFAKITGETNE